MIITIFISEVKLHMSPKLLFLVVAVVAVHVHGLCGKFIIHNRINSHNSIAFVSRSGCIS